MNCKQCNKPNRPEAHFCKWCGTPIASASSTIMPEIVGMEDVKEQISEVVSTYQVMSQRATNGVIPRLNYDITIAGPTGCGKTTLVKAIAKVFYATGITTKEEVEFVQPPELNGFISEWSENPDMVSGGILCIENVEKIIGDGSSNQTTDLDAVLSARQTSNDFVLILCGNDTDFTTYLQNERSVHDRFSRHFVLSPATLDELVELCSRRLTEYRIPLTQDARDRLTRIFKKMLRDQPESLNGHLTDNMAQDIFSRAVRRDRQCANTLPDDIEGEEYVVPTVEEVMASLDKLVGIDSVRQTLKSITDSVEECREQGEAFELKDHYLFLGPPGTGKTTVARKFGDIFSSLELLPSGHIVEVSRDQLVSQWKGETPKLVARCVQQAMGGILFIDEAYTLYKDENDDVGKEAVDTLLRLMENERGKFVVIAAGYDKDMQRFLESNEGLASRFNVTVQFRDYSPQELEEVFRNMISAGRHPYDLEPEAEAALHNFFKRMVNMKMKDFANARTVRTTVENAIKRHRSRLQEEKAEGKDTSAYTYTLSRLDIEGEEALEHKTVEEVMEELDEFVGMESVKKAIRELADDLQTKREMMEMGIAEAANTSVHIVLKGNPGTGKTSVAEKLGKIFKAIGLLPTDKVTVKEAKDLLSSYHNETAKVVNKAVDEAMGGILFIDEAYQLLQISGGNDKDPTGLQAVTALITRMTKDAGKFVLVCAGYPKQMDEFVREGNAGFSRRFTHTITIEDYSTTELIEIFRRIAKKKKNILPPEAEEVLVKKVSQMVAAKSENFGNAGEITRLYDEMSRRRSTRLSKMRREGAVLEKEDYLTILPEDIPFEMPKVVSVEESLAALNDLVGLDEVKAAVTDLAETLIANRRRAESSDVKLEVNLDHYLFLGNPGTGKTTVARIMADIFCTLGLLPTNKLIEVTRKDLVAGWQGQTAPTVERVVKSALGGVLFIDEAYSLKLDSHDTFGNEAINTLVPMLLDYKNRMICIAAGYEREMKEFLDANSGLASRFNETIHFADYGPDALAEIFLMKAKKQKFTLTPDAEAAMRQHFNHLYAHRDQNFGNAREVNNYFEKVKRKQAKRINKAGDTVVDEMELIADDMRTDN